MMIRGIGASGTTELTCTPPNYWNGGLNTCCAPLGTSAEEDPCSIINSPAFLQAQAADVGPLQANGAPVSAGYNNPDEAALASISSYPQNVQIDALNCVNNPGATFVDTMGMSISCPSESVTGQSGAQISIYTAAQIAAMIAPTATPTIETASNVVGTSIPASVVQNPATTSIATPSPTTTVASGGSTPVATKTTSTGSTVPDDLSFLTDDDLISGVPNWVVGVGALAALMILPAMLGGRR